MARRILTIGIPAIAAYGIYTTNRLLSEYPIEPVSTYHQAPSVIPHLRQAQAFGPVEVVYARVPSRSRSSGLRADQATSPLDQLLSAFWSTWTLRLEGLMVSLFVGSAIPSELRGINVHAQTHQEPVAFARSIFPIYRYYPSSVVFQWRFSPDMGGMQELAAVETEDGMTEISYACAQYGISDGSGGVLDRLGVAFHRIYMRFLIDQAKGKLERE